MDKYMTLHPDTLAFPSDELVTWYDQHKRDLPWRQDKNPYTIWISEVMLQQTQVQKVIPYFNAFTTAFPTVEALANATEEEVLKVWAGLGYYSRGKRLRLCAMDIMDQYEGQFPRELAKVLKLPGIGPYTAGAILSIAYDQQVPAVDGNVFRVFSRFYNRREDIGLPATRKIFEEMALKSLPKRSGDFNQALMDLGATICTPQNPRCESCPLKEDCLALTYGCQKEVPVKAKRTKNKALDMEVALVRYQDQFFVTWRPSTGLLSDLPSFPIVETESNDSKGTTVANELEETFGLEVGTPRPLGKYKHVFSHRTWHMSLYEFHTTVPKIIDYPKCKWVSEDELKELGLPTAFAKLLTDPK